ncbi:hypothetical protein [Halovivax limisalsi]|uniref:hypothetical protein n=1 Tax=Halovivax limisalsi TaxID=1453760 RepID=UPI001FFC8726|nr:hypothetical protein [Halovivax limisalsi]
MGRYEYGEPSTSRSCERCGQGLGLEHSVRLVARHEGARSNRYRDVERYVCGDCVAALGMLEFEERESDGRSGTAEAGRPQPARSIGE